MICKVVNIWVFLKMIFARHALRHRQNHFFLKFNCNFHHFLIHCQRRVWWLSPPPVDYWLTSWGNANVAPAWLMRLTSSVVAFSLNSFSSPLFFFFSIFWYFGCPPGHLKCARNDAAPSNGIAEAITRTCYYYYYYWLDFVSYSWLIAMHSNLEWLAIFWITEALRLYGSRLTAYERLEMEHYPEIWFLGLDARKIHGEEGAPQNGGYDDENGSYHKVS